MVKGGVGDLKHVARVIALNMVNTVACFLHFKLFLFDILLICFNLYAPTYVIRNSSLHRLLGCCPKVLTTGGM